MSAQACALRKLATLPVSMTPQRTAASGTVTPHLAACRMRTRATIALGTANAFCMMHTILLAMEHPGGIATISREATWTFYMRDIRGFAFLLEASFSTCGATRNISSVKISVMPTRDACPSCLARAVPTSTLAPVSCMTRTTNRQMTTGAGLATTKHTSKAVLRSLPSTAFWQWYLSYLLSPIEWKSK